jgi:hypothetical protein
MQWAGWWRPWRRRLGNGEGELPLVEAWSCPVNARCRGAAPLINLLRNMSVVKHRCQGRTAIAQLAGAIGSAHSQIFYRCRKRACGCSADSRLVFAGAPAEFS